MWKGTTKEDGGKVTTDKGGDKGTTKKDGGKDMTGKGGGDKGTTNKLYQKSLIL